jgi:hypothetical protein
VTYRLSHSSPSAAVCFLVLSSFRQRSCRVSVSSGAASCRSRIFFGVSAACWYEIHRVLSNLDIANHVRLYRPKRCRTKDICQRSVCQQQLRSSKFASGFLGSGISSHSMCEDGVCIPNSVVKLSAASKNSVVLIALPLLLSTGTSVKLLFIVSKKVPPGG